MGQVQSQLQSLARQQQLLTQEQSHNLPHEDRSDLLGQIQNCGATQPVTFKMSNTPQTSAQNNGNQRLIHTEETPQGAYQYYSLPSMTGMSQNESNKAFVSNDFSFPYSQQLTQPSTQYYQPSQTETHVGVSPVPSSSSKVLAEVTQSLSQARQAQMQNSAILQSSEYAQPKISEITQSVQNFDTQTPPITNTIPSMSTFGVQTNTPIQTPIAQVSMPTAPTYNSLAPANTPICGTTNSLPATQQFGTQIPITTQPARTQTTVPMANQHIPVSQIYSGYPYNLSVGARAPNPFRSHAIPTTQVSNQYYTQQDSSATAVPTWSMPVRTNLFPVSAVQQVHMPSTVTPQHNALQNTNIANTIPSIPALSGAPVNQNCPQQSATPYSKKEVHPDNFDGSGKTEWSDYLVHFEQCAKWNQWSDAQKAQMLSIHLCGEAQRLLSGLSVAQLGNFDAIKQIISDRYEPKEKDVAYRCQFRYRKREKGENASDYGYHLNRLAQKAYPNLTVNQLEVHVIDQFITSLNNYELQKHVQFDHPKS